MKSLFITIAAMSAVLFLSTLTFGQEETPRIINGGLLNGKAVSLVKPAYPAEAKAAGVQGTVNVEVMIDEGGNVISATVIKPKDADTELAVETVDAWAALRSAAEQAALESKFSPTTLSGNPVKVKGVIVYNFVSGTVIDGGILNSKAIELPSPIYPDAAKAVAAVGTVNVQVVIDENGNIVSATAISGHPLLQAAAVDAARRAKFSPTSLNGKPVKVTGTLRYNFDLPVPAKAYK
jgi:TonB family protein